MPAEKTERTQEYQFADYYAGGIGGRMEIHIQRGQSLRLTEAQAAHVRSRALCNKKKERGFPEQDGGFDILQKPGEVKVTKTVRDPITGQKKKKLIDMGEGSPPSRTPLTQDEKESIRMDLLIDAATAGKA